MVLGPVFKKRSLITYSVQINFLKNSNRFLFILFSSDREGAGVRDLERGPGSNELRRDGNQRRLRRDGHLPVRLREALRDSAARGGSDSPGPRCHCSGPVRYRKNLHDWPHRLPDRRYQQQRVRPLKSLFSFPFCTSFFLCFLN